MQEIKRERYIEQLVARRENGSVKVITGIRRCGKSYILFNLYKNYLISTGVRENQIIALALDDEKNRKYRNVDVLYNYLTTATSGGEKMYYIFLDEVQFAIADEEMKSGDIRLYGVLNGLLRQGNTDIYVTGSNSKFLSSDVLTEFRGRGDSFAEFMSVYDGGKYEGFDEYSMYGGLPLILSRNSDEQKSKYLSDLFEETYKKDVIDRYKLRGDTVLDNVVDILASAVGSLTNPTKLADTFNSHGIKTNKNTIAAYIDHLKDAFIISMAKRYDIKGKKYIGSPYKFYFTDIGLRNARLNFRQQEQTHILENMIYNELMVRGFNVDVGVVEYRRRGEDGKLIEVKNEVDFVCNKGNRRYYIQSAFAIPDKEKMEQEQASFDRIDDSFKKIIVLQQHTKPWRNEKGYLIINVIDFLLDPDSLEL